MPEMGDCRCGLERYYLLNYANRNHIGNDVLTMFTILYDKTKTVMGDGLCGLEVYLVSRLSFEI